MAALPYASVDHTPSDAPFSGIGDDRMVVVRDEEARSTGLLYDEPSLGVKRLRFNHDFGILGVPVGIFESDVSIPTERLHISTTGIGITDGITVTSTGNVGIGMTTPTNKLVVNGNADVFGALFVSGGAVTLPVTTTIGSVTATEIGHLSGVTSNIQTQINALSGGATPTVFMIQGGTSPATQSATGKVTCLNVVGADTATGWDAVNNHYEIQEAGYYSIGAKVQVVNPAPGARGANMLIKVNGTTFISTISNFVDSSQSGTEYTALDATGIKQLAVGDTVHVEWSDGGLSGYYILASNCYLHLNKL